MSTGKFFQQLAAKETNLNGNAVSEVKPNQVQVDRSTASDALISGVAVSSVITCAVLFVALSKTRTIKREEIADIVKQLSPAPCRNCRFFSSNAFLKCAVQPSIVLTAKAVDCSDYQPRNPKFPH